MIHHVLVCAATSVEYDACAAGIKASSNRTHKFELLRVGVGGANASRVLAERLGQGDKPAIVISTGFAGALSEDLPLHAWVTARSIYKWSNGEAALVVAASRFGAGQEVFGTIVDCDLVSVDSLAGASSSVRAFAERAEAAGKPAIVDMESAALGVVAKADGRQYAVLRVISDTPSQPLPEFLSPFTDAMTDVTTASRARSVLRGVAGALRDPKGVARVVTEGRDWARTLERGWTRFANVLGGPG